MINANNKSKEYLAGYDCGLNGTNLINSHFSHFSSREATDDWEAGKKAGETEKQTMIDLGLFMAAAVQIKADKRMQGSIECPKCKGKINFAKAPSNKHIRMKCETPGCLQGME